MNEKIEHFCSDEFLKIPQYVYNNNPRKYIRLLEKHFGASSLSDKEPNHIHNLILELSPKHIITTNYDPLIENCEESNRDYYTVISSDKELLEKGKSSNRFILKMHGDYKELNKIVLKEDDYLRYEQTHILISTLIKSLLVNHIFLFVGYSINDYNFKQIIEWIEYLSEQVGAEKNIMPTHFVIRTGSGRIRKYEKEYLKKKRIEIINAKDLTNYIELANTKSDFIETHARQLYATMKSFIDPMADISILGSAGALYDRLRVFDELTYIPYTSLIKVLDLEEIYNENVLLKNVDAPKEDLLFGYHELLLKAANFSLLKNALEEIPRINDYFVYADFYEMREFNGNDFGSVLKFRTG